MKRTAKNTLVLLTAAVMLMALIPAGAFAEDDFGIWVCGKKVTSRNMSGPGWSFDLSKFTLKLKGFSYSGTALLSHESDGTDLYCAIFYKGGPGLTISLSGKNSIALTGIPKDKTMIFAIASAGDLTFSGKGSLDISTDRINGDNTGIWAKQNMTMKGGTVHISTGGGRGSVPLDCRGSLSVEKGSLELEAGPADYPVALWCRRSMIMSGGSVSAVCGNIEQADPKDESGRYTYGIRIDSDLIMEDGQIYAKAGDTGTSGQQTSIGMAVQGNMNINGGTITAESGMANTQSVGCGCMGQFMMQGGELTAVGNGVSGIFYSSSSNLKLPSAVRSFGFLSNSRQLIMNINGGTFTAKAGKSLSPIGICIGLRTNSGLDIGGASVTVEADDSSSQNIGVENYGVLFISSDVKKFTACGPEAAVSGQIITAIDGTGYSDTAGKNDETAVQVGKEPLTLTFRQICFPAVFSSSNGEK